MRKSLCCQDQISKTKKKLPLPQKQRNPYGIDMHRDPAVLYQGFPFLGFEFTPAIFVSIHFETPSLVVIGQSLFARVATIHLRVVVIVGVIGFVTEAVSSPIRTITEIPKSTHSRFLRFRKMRLAEIDGV